MQESRGLPNLNNGMFSCTGKELMFYFGNDHEDMEKHGTEINESASIRVTGVLRLDTGTGLTTGQQNAPSGSRPLTSRVQSLLSSMVLGCRCSMLVVLLLC